MLQLIVNWINDVNKGTIYFVWEHATEFCDNVTMNAPAGTISVQQVKSEVKLSYFDKGIIQQKILAFAT